MGTIFYTGIFELETLFFAIAINLVYAYIRLLARHLIISRSKLPFQLTINLLISPLLKETYQ